MRILHTSINSFIRLTALSLTLICVGLQTMSQSNTAKTLQYKQLFPRNQTYEYQVLKAIDFNPSPTLANINLNETPKSFSELNDLEKAFGDLALLAVELYAAEFDPNADSQKLIRDIGNRNMPYYKPKITYILGLLVLNVVAGKGSDAPTLALKGWATDIYRSIKIRSARAVLDEYEKWKADPCGYKADGYKAPPDCALKDKNYAEWFSEKKPPEEIIGKAGLKSVLAGNVDAVTSTMALGVTAVSVAVASSMVQSGLGVLTPLLVEGATKILPTSLYAAFGGSGAAGIGSVSWAGVVAAPVAAIVMVVVVGTMEGFKVVEATKIEPMLKMKLGAAMVEHIDISNALMDDNARSMFIWAFQEAALKGFQLTNPKMNGEVRFYCQAGYVSKFKLSYTVGGKPINLETSDLTIGNEQYLSIPHDAKNIRVQGFYAAAGWKEIFNQTLVQPTYICYTSYGTVFEPKYKNDCPEVGSMVAKKNELTLTHGGGYVARLKVTYTQNGQTITLIDNNGLTAGWRKVFTIPQGASNVNVQGWSATGLAWEPWKQAINKTWPNPPNECLKIYGTTLDPKWNNECN